MDELKVMIIGAGRRADETYIPIMKSMADRFRIVSICDENASIAEQVGQKHQLKHYSDLDVMCESEEADFAIIAVSADKTNHDAAMRAMEYDLNLLIETPIAVDLPSADQISRLASRHNTKLEIAESYYRRPHERVKQRMIENGLFGEIKFAYSRFVGHACHAVSLLRSYIGFNLTPVFAWGFDSSFNVKNHNIGGNSNGRSIDTELWQHGVVQFKNGSRAVYDFTTLSYESPLRWSRTKATTEIYGEHGMCIGIEPIVFDGNSSKPIDIKRRVTEVDGVEILEAYVVEAEEEIVWENPYRDYALSEAEIGVADSLVAFERAIKNGDNSEIYGFANGRTDREIELAFGWSSDLNGAPVELT